MLSIAWITDGCLVPGRKQACGSLYLTITNLIIFKLKSITNDETWRLTVKVKHNFVGFETDKIDRS